jgi:predicted nucleotidyltransferase
VDLVIELPFVYATGSAEQFAKGAVGILQGLGAVDWLCFGSEAGNVEPLQEIATLLAGEWSGEWQGESAPGVEMSSFGAAIRSAMREGISYAKAVETIVSKTLGSSYGRLLRSPNNTLAIEYLKQLILTGSRIAPVTIGRHKAGLDDMDAESGIAGATAIRALLQQSFAASASASAASASAASASAASSSAASASAASASASSSGQSAATPNAAANPGSAIPDDVARYLPEATVTLLEAALDAGENMVTLDDLLPFASYAVHGIGAWDRTDAADADAKAAPSASEGLDNRLFAALRQGDTMTEVLRSTKTKRYPETRIRRLLTHTAVGLTKEALSTAEQEPLYARVLAMDEKGARLLRRIRKQGGIHIATNMNKDKGLSGASPVTLAFDRRAEDLRRLMERSCLAGFDDTCVPPLFLKSDDIDHNDPGMTSFY